MKFEDNERIKDVLNLVTTKKSLDKKRRKESLFLTRKLDNNINEELAKDLLDAYKRFGDRTFVSMIAEKAGDQKRMEIEKRLRKARKEGDIEEEIICSYELDPIDHYYIDCLSPFYKNLWRSVNGASTKNLKRFKKSFPKLVSFVMKNNKRYGNKPLGITIKF